MPAECRVRAAECQKMAQNARRPHVRDTLAEIERMWNRLAVEAEVSEVMLTRFLEGAAFGPDEIAIMVAAYEVELTQINVSGHNDPTAETLAQTIVMLASGESAILFGWNREQLRSYRARRKTSPGPHRPDWLHARTNMALVHGCACR